LQFYYEMHTRPYFTCSNIRQCTNVANKYFQMMWSMVQSVLYRSEFPECHATTVHTRTHPFNSPFSGTTQVSRYQKGKTSVDFTVARDSEWQWHQLGHMQVCTLLQADNHTSTPPLCFLQAGCPSCRPTNSVKALKVVQYIHTHTHTHTFNGPFPGLPR